MTKITRPAPKAEPIVWPRANPEALAKFEPRTKECVHNCGGHRDDPRSDLERQFLCEDCVTHDLPRVSVVARVKGILAVMARHGLEMFPDEKEYLDRWLIDALNPEDLRSWKTSACVGSSVAASRPGVAYPVQRAFECIAWAALYVDTPQERNGEAAAHRMLDMCATFLEQGGVRLNG